MRDCDEHHHHITSPVENICIYVVDLARCSQSAHRTVFAGCRVQRPQHTTDTTQDPLLPPPIYSASIYSYLKRDNSLRDKRFSSIGAEHDVPPCCRTAEKCIYILRKLDIYKSVPRCGVNSHFARPASKNKMSSQHPSKFTSSRLSHFAAIYLESSI